MPRVIQQNNRVPPTRTPTKISESVIDRIQDVGELRSGLKLTVYGRGKTGKTRLACTFPGPVLLIGSEDGTKSVLPGTKFVRVTSSEELTQLIQHLHEGDYKSVVLDTAGGFQDILVKEVGGLADIPVTRDWGMISQQQWGIVNTQFAEHCGKLLALAERPGLNVIVIAHERNFTSEDTPSDVMMPSIGPSLTPKAAGWLNAACDYVCNTFIREETVLKKGKAGEKEITQRVPTGKKEFCLRIGPHPIFMTGFRLRPGLQLPELLVDPHYDKIAAVISGKSSPAGK